MIKALSLITSFSLVIFFTNISTDIGENNTNSRLFKMSRNSNRIALFESLQTTLKIKPNRATSTAYQYSTYSDVLALFGEPTLRIQNSSLVYTLNPANGCKAVFEFDGTKSLTYIGIRDCN
jgi:hypothetical protein